MRWRGFARRWLAARALWPRQEAFASSLVGGAECERSAVETGYRIRLYVDAPAEPEEVLSTTVQHRSAAAGNERRRRLVVTTARRQVRREYDLRTTARRLMTQIETGVELHHDRRVGCTICREGGGLLCATRCIRIDRLGPHLGTHRAEIGSARRRHLYRTEYSDLHGGGGRLRPGDGRKRDSRDTDQ